MNNLKLVAIADTHGMHAEIDLPPGDILIVAGDICPWGTIADVHDFAQWLHDQPFRHKLVIAGNHDEVFERKNTLAREMFAALAPEATYLQDKMVTIDGLAFYGSPWTPTFMQWYFMADRGEHIRRKWNRIPEETDVLITHGPPAGILDNVKGIPQGCVDLWERVLEIHPRYHIFGHIHEGYGMITKEGTTFINASTCNAKYRTNNQPVIIDVHRN